MGAEGEKVAKRKRGKVDDPESREPRGNDAAPSRAAVRGGLKPALQARLDALPRSPGVYLFKDRQGRVLYVGKASELRSRVRSYFRAGSPDGRYFVDRLPAELGELETYVTKSEKEAALLENTLIKEHQPRYNFKLRDDKDFISLRLDPAEPWPRLQVARRPRQDGARYFGPYHSASAARSMLRAANRHFRLRTCSDRELASRARPCLQYQIRRCPGACVLPADREEYAVQIRNTALFLEGRHDELARLLQRQMAEASGQQRYEQAAVYRDQIRAIESALERQVVSSVSGIDQDVFGLHRRGDRVQLAVLLVRRGRVVDVRAYQLQRSGAPDDELLASFLVEYYQRSSFVPDEILVPVPIEGRQGLQELLSEQRSAALRGAGSTPQRRRSGRVCLIQPRQGRKALLLHMAMDNAAHAFTQNDRAGEDARARLAEIQRRLGLRTLPRRIECVDISHLGGQDAVAAIAVQQDGQPDRKRYRSFNLRQARGGDDYGAMLEVLGRRFRRAKSGEPAWAPPDLLLVDGGKGQLNAALQVFEELGIRDISLAALAKETTNVRGDAVAERIYLPGRMNPIELTQHTTAAAAKTTDGTAAPPSAADTASVPAAATAPPSAADAASAPTAATDPNVNTTAAIVAKKTTRKTSAEKASSAPATATASVAVTNTAFNLLLAVRDEAHRFSNRQRIKLGARTRLRSGLHGIAGVGPRTRERLLRQLGSVRAIRSATTDDLIKAGASRRQAEAIRTALHGDREQGTG